MENFSARRNLEISEVRNEQFEYWRGCLEESQRLADMDGGRWDMVGGLACEQADPAGAETLGRE